MDYNTNGDECKDYEPTARDEALADLADCLEERAAAEERRAYRREEYEADLAALDRQYDEDMSAMRLMVQAWDRRIGDARRRLEALELPEPAPIAGGAPYDPTAEDWAEYRAHFDRIDRELPDPEPTPPLYGYE